MTRSLRIFLAVVVLASLPQPASAEARPSLVVRVSFTAEQLGGFSAGDIDEYSDGSILVRMRLRGGLGTNADGTENDAMAAEWEFNAFSGSTCGTTAAHDPVRIAHLHYENPVDKYGPRILERRLDGPLLNEIGSVELVHEGPLSFHGQTSPGRHHLACVPLAS